MDSIARVLAVGAVMLTLSGCQLIGTLLPIDQEGGGQLPEEGTCARYVVTAGAGEAVTPETLEQVRIVVENRVNASGVAEPVVLMDTDGQLQVGLPSLDPESAEEIRHLISARGVVEFLPVPGELQGSLGQGLLPEAMQGIEPLFGGAEVDGATVAEDPATRSRVVDLRLKDTGARILDDYAAEHHGEQLAIVLDGRVLSTSTIQGTSRAGRVRISGGQGDLAAAEANAFLTILKFGPLPLGIREVGFGDCASTGSPGPAAEPSP
jgi:SecD/SecF fusion protein